MESHYKLVKGHSLQKGDIIYVKGWGNVLISDKLMPIIKQESFPFLSGTYTEIFVKQNRNDHPAFLYGILNNSRYPKLISISLNNKVYKHVRRISTIH